MVERAHDPRRLDVAAFAADAGALEGAWPLAGFGRLCGDAAAAADGAVTWHVQGQTRPVRGGEPQLWLRVQATARVPAVCQRCLQPMLVDVAVDRWLRFVADEAQAAELDADSDDDVLALERALDLHSLVEDELLLALPMVPRHGRCGQPLVAPAAGTPPRREEPDAAANPFAALAGWPRKPPVQ